MFNNKNMNPVRAGLGVCILGVCEFEYVRVNEMRVGMGGWSIHVIVSTVYATVYHILLWIICHSGFKKKSQTLWNSESG